VYKTDERISLKRQVTELALVLRENKNAILSNKQLTNVVISLKEDVTNIW